MKKIFQRKWVILLILVLIFVGGYFGYQKLAKKGNAPRYVTATVEKGTLILSVSGSGQILALDQIDIKPKVSGEVDYLKVKNGQEVKKGELILKLDTTDIEREVNEAEANLETAKLELEKLLSPPDELTLLQAENALIQAKNSKQKAEDNLEKSYEDGFNSVANVFLDLPDIMTGIHNILFSYDFSNVQQNIIYYTNIVSVFDNKVFQYKEDVYNKYQIAKKDYDKISQDYKLVSRFSEKEEIEFLIDQTYETTKKIAETVKSAQNFIQFYQDTLTDRGLIPQPFSNAHLASLENYTGKLNNYLSSLLLAKSTIENYKKSIEEAERTIKERELSLEKLKAGPDELEIRAKRIAVQQREDALSKARENLANHYIYAPFDGIVATVNVKKGDSVSSGITVATLITKEKIAKITLNEIDAAKVKIGQKANINFDAIEDLNIVGEVVEIDTIGEVSQGVVSFGVKIALDTDDERIKPGMSVSATIITEAKPNVLLVPNSAIKREGDLTFVQLVVDKEALKKKAFSESAIKNQEVKVGLSNDTMTEITEGLKEGDVVISQIITQSLNQTQRNQGFNPSMMRMMR